MSISKQEALEKLAKLEKETADLRKILEASDAPKALLNRGKFFISYISGATYVIQQDSGWKTVEKSAGNRFESYSEAESYAKAINTMLRLRQCDGSISPSKPRGFLYYINYDLGTNDIVIYEMAGSYSLKLNYISPFFSTKTFAEKAIACIGKETLVYMFKTLHGMN